MTRSRVGVLGIALAALTARPTPDPLHAQAAACSAKAYTAEGVMFDVEAVTHGLGLPFAIAVLPDGRLLVSERDSVRLTLVDPATGAKQIIGSVPGAFYDADEKEGGLLDVVLDPDFARTRRVYLAYAQRTEGNGSTLVVAEARLDSSSLREVTPIFEATPAYTTIGHYGSRLLLRDGYLFITIGDRHQRAAPQHLGTHAGKIIRIRADGRVPDDNPFARRAGALPEIWSYGHRNPQGIAFDAANGALLVHEHGPMGGDELNIVRAGTNYGWPLASFGLEYEGGPVGEGRVWVPGTELPAFTWSPSIAPSGMIIHSGDGFAGWSGHLLIGALGRRHLNRIVMREGLPRREERLLQELRLRIRSVAEGPGGLVYLGADDGRILRLRPCAAPPAEVHAGSR